MAVNQDVNFFELIRIRKAVWDVLAVPDVVDGLQGKGFDPSCRSILESMFGLLQRRVSAFGPPGGDLTDDLGDEIREFRRQPRRGPKLRALWFYDAGHVIVCTNLEWKRNRVEGKRTAMRIRDEYLTAKKANRIRITRIEDK